VRTLLEIKNSDLGSWCSQNKVWGNLTCMGTIAGNYVYGIESVMCEIPPCENFGGSDSFTIVPERVMSLSSITVTLDASMWGEQNFRGTVSVGLRFYKGGTIVRDVSGNDFFGYQKTFYSGGVFSPSLKYVIAGTKLTMYVDNVEFFRTELRDYPDNARILVVLRSEEGLLCIGGFKYLRVDYEDPLAEVLELIMSFMPLIILFFVVMMLFRMFRF